MSITVRRGLKGRLRSSQNVVFLVHSDDQEGLGPAMRAVRADIYAMDAGSDSVPGLQPGDANNPSYVSDPITIPGGSLVMVDFGHVPPTLRLQLPDVVSAALEREGIRNATIEPAPEIGDHYERLDRFVPAARAWLRGFAQPGAPRVVSRPPDPLVDAGLSWLREQHQDNNQLAALAISVEIPLTWDQHRPIIDALLGSSHPLPNPTPVLSTDFTSQAAYAEFGVLHGFGALLTAGRAKRTQENLAQQLRRQQTLIRQNVENLQWAGVTIDPNDRHFLISNSEYDEALPPKPMWYQLFSPTQIDQLGRPPSESVELPNDRVELTVGEPEQWIPGHPDRGEVLRKARDLLNPN